VIGLSPEGPVVVREFEVAEAMNLAGEPRDTIQSGRREPLAIADDAEALLALSRALLMSGGLESALDLSLTYVSEREQFGRPISRFQAIQHHMAVMAAEVAAAIRSAEAGLAGLGGEREIDEIAQAKVRVGESVGVVAELAQQVHGAMGYTHEHRLHHCTRRLWAWRDEYGTEQEWQERLGRRIARLADDQGIDAVWQFVASRG
jgi:acyl-CoA dehydrogenase